MSKMISKPMARSAQTMKLSSVKIRTIYKWTELSLEPHHLAVPFGASKMISKLMVHLAQNLHLSSTDTNTVSKQKEAGFHMTYIA